MKCQLGKAFGQMDNFPRPHKSLTHIRTKAHTHTYTQLVLVFAAVVVGDALVVGVAQVNRKFPAPNGIKSGALLS